LIYIIKIKQAIADIPNNDMGFKANLLKARAISGGGTGA
jgi:hypothetical protein